MITISIMPRACFIWFSLIDPNITRILPDIIDIRDDALELRVSEMTSAQELLAVMMKSHTEDGMIRLKQKEVFLLFVLMQKVGICSKFNMT